MVEQKLVVAQFQQERNSGVVQLLGNEKLEDLNKKGWRVVQIGGLVQQAQGQGHGNNLFLDGYVGMVLLEKETESELTSGIR